MRGIIVSIGLACLFVPIDAADIRFAGVAIRPGSIVRADVPLTAVEKSFASDAATDVPERAVAVLAVPRNFDVRRTWPVLVVFSTSDFKRLNRDDLVDFYQKTALYEGWVIIAGDSSKFPRHDTNGWRAAMTFAALDALDRSFPGSAKWPVAVAGFSGGAKRASLLAPLLYLRGCRLCGIYLSGVNEDVLSIAYSKSHIGPNFLNIPVFISNGTNDAIAPSSQAAAVAASIKSTGFKQVGFHRFTGRHQVNNDHTREALRSFYRRP